MENHGSVKDYNGVYGIITDSNGKIYTLLDINIIPGEIIEKDTMVSFQNETVKTPETEINIAKKVKVMKKNNH